MSAVIAIDGPAASGKSSVSARLAKRLGVPNVNSGGFYRAVTWEFLRMKVNLDSESAVVAALKSVLLDCGLTPDGASYIEVNGYVPGEALRADRINSLVSRVSAMPAVRELVTRRLRQIAAGRTLVMEGRDIGSVVFPETPHKFYLDASPEIRQARREAEELADQVADRDKMDSSRAVAPLTIPPDARVIDTSSLTLDGVVDAIADILRDAGLAPNSP